MSVFITVTMTTVHLCNEWSHGPDTAGRAFSAGMQSLK